MLSADHCFCWNFILQYIFKVIFVNDSDVGNIVDQHFEGGGPTLLKKINTLSIQFT